MKIIKTKLGETHVFNDDNNNLVYKTYWNSGKVSYDVIRWNIDYLKKMLGDVCVYNLTMLEES